MIFDFMIDIEDIRKNPNIQHWFIISGSETLSEDFIREFRNKVSWCYISYYQSLSKDFIVEFFDKIDFELLLMNNLISKEIKDFCKIFI